MGDSVVQSNQTNNSLGLVHLDPKLFLPNIETKVKNKGVQKAILIVQTEHLKDIQVSIGKSNLPALIKFLISPTQLVTPFWSILCIIILTFLMLVLAGILKEIITS